jgi:hypothetical protein
VPRTADPARNRTLRMRPMAPATADYEDTDFSHAVLRSQRSDPLGVAVRLGAVAATYALLALAVHRGTSSPYLLMPLVLEYVGMTWIGMWMCRVVDCPKFRGAHRNTATANVVASLLLVGLLVLWVVEARRPGGGPPHWGVGLAVLASLGGMLFATMHEIARWRRSGGVFVWSVTLFVGCRMVLLLLLGTVGLLPLLLVASMVSGSGRQSEWLAQGLWAWPVWALLLLLDLGVVLLLAWLHRRAQREAAAAPA